MFVRETICPKCSRKAIYNVFIEDGLAMYTYICHNCKRAWHQYEEKVLGEIEETNYWEWVELLNDADIPDHIVKEIDEKIARGEW